MVPAADVIGLPTPVSELRVGLQTLERQLRGVAGDKGRELRYWTRNLKSIKLAAQHLWLHCISAFFGAIVMLLSCTASRQRQRIHIVGLRRVFESST